jgi:hypothetical protein
MPSTKDYSPVDQNDKISYSDSDGELSNISQEPRYNRSLYRYRYCAHLLAAVVGGVVITIFFILGSVVHPLSLSITPPESSQSHPQPKEGVFAHIPECKVPILPVVVQTFKYSEPSM